MKECPVLPDFVPGEITVPPIPKFQFATASPVNWGVLSRTRKNTCHTNSW